MDVSFLARQRAELKNRLALDKRRQIFSHCGYRPVCVACGKPILKDGYDMHEVFFTRGDVSGNERLFSLIMVPANCVLVETGYCHQNVATVQGQRRAVAHLIKAEGYCVIEDWLHSLKPYFRGLQVEDALRLLIDVHVAHA